MPRFGFIFENRRVSAMQKVLRHVDVRPTVDGDSPWEPLTDVPTQMKFGSNH
jgi:hypothetical protein